MATESTLVLKDEAGLDVFLGRFEEGAIGPDAWRHEQHLMMAAAYLSRFPEEEAIRRIRDGILHLNHCHGVATTPTRGYHETLTIFWARVIRAFLNQCPIDAPLIERIRLLVAEYGGRKDLFREYYSGDIVRSQARYRWEEPDLKPLA